MIFSFQLFVHNPLNNGYYPFLRANCPFTSAKRKLLSEIIEKGGMLAVAEVQKENLLQQLDMVEDQIEDLRPPPVHELEARRKQLLQQENQEASKENFKALLNDAMTSDDFKPLINAVRNEVIAFSPRVSSTTTLASLLCEIILMEDTFLNRSVALSYLLAKGVGITDESSLGDLICATFYSHLGYTQLPHLCMSKPFLEFNDSLTKEWKKHPGLSMHILRKAQIDLSSRCKTIIEQHHERYDGQGFPQMKKGQYIEPLALVLGAASHLLEFTSGRVSGSKSSIQSFVLNFRNKTYLPGMEVEFGPLISESLSYLVDTTKQEEDTKSAA
ncbi:MAG: HD domain-containing phosphohydrolase [bacterium]